MAEGESHEDASSFFGGEKRALKSKEVCGGGGSYRERRRRKQDEKHSSLEFLVRLLGVRGECKKLSSHPPLACPPISCHPLLFFSPF